MFSWSPVATDDERSKAPVEDLCAIGYIRTLSNNVSRGVEMLVTIYEAAKARRNEVIEDEDGNLEKKLYARAELQLLTKFWDIILNLRTRYETVENTLDALEVEWEWLRKCL